MDTAENCRNASALLDESNAAFEIVAAEKNVIERCRKTSDLCLIGPERSRDDRSSSVAKKSSARDVFHFSCSYLRRLHSRATIVKRAGAGDFPCYPGAGL